jgi:Concanavalin A-like lectin/glucanases superfamily
MKRLPQIRFRILALSAAIPLFLSAAPLANAQGASLLNDLVSYWPMDAIQGTKTPDLKSGYDLNLQNLTAADLIDGHRGKGFHFTPSRNTYLFRIHGAGDELPANKHTSFTLAFWARALFTGQNDKRLFSEGSNANNDPIFTIGTHSTGTEASVDLYIRQGGEEVAHIRTLGQPLDGVDWHHIAFVQTAQPDDSATRIIYLDGALDDQTFADRPSGKVYNMNITSFGAVLRTASAAQIDGDVDEAAIWKRALTAEEVADLHTNGMPDLTPPLEPLQINSFTADFRKVRVGGTVRLRWDATKDSTIVIAPGVGDVTAMSAFGVGSTDVTVAAPTTYMLTISRGAEAPVQKSLSVGTVAGVAAGWRWLEDFDDLDIGTLGGQARWLPAEGVFNVSQIGPGKAVTATGGTDLTALDLKSLTVLEQSSATLFFRFCYQEQEPDLPIGLRVGLTEKTIRFHGDFADNVGTYIRFDRFASSPLTIQAINGQGGAREDAVYTFEPNQVYNIWIDITNNLLTDTDMFSVHIGRVGGGPRETIFQNFASDRTPGEVPLLGFPQPHINYLFAVTDPEATPQALVDVALDDFYLSAPGTFANSEPVPSSFGKIPVTTDFRITNIQYAKATGQVTLTWNSSPQESYQIYTSPNLATWTPAGAPIPSQGTTTTSAVTGSFTSSETYFRVGR